MPRRGLQAPSPAVAAALLAALLAVVGAANPTAGGGSAAETTIIVDRGLTMSARGPGGRRYAQLAAAVQPLARAILGAGTVRVVELPGDSTWTTRDQWAAIAGSLAPTAVDTSASLSSTIAACLRDSAGPILVLTDRPVETASDRVIVVRPSSTPRNIGIIALAARENPTPQIMLRLQNTGAEVRVAVDVRSGDRGARQDLTVAGGVASVFLPLSGGAVGDVVEAVLQVDDDLDADNRAWLVRGHRRPWLEPRSPLPEALRRMVAVYRRANPSGEGAGSVAVVARPAGLAGLEPGVVFSPAVGESFAATQADRGLTVAAHPVTANVDWPAIVRDAAIDLSHPPEWTPLVRLGDRVLVARRDQPVRQIWVGFDSPGWPRTADYVVFWANVFDWVGGSGAEKFGSEPVQRLGPEWANEDGHVPLGTPTGLWPGLYRRPDGVRRAIHAPRVTIPSMNVEEWETKLSGVAARSGGKAQPVAAALLLAAAGCVVAAALTWRPRSVGSGAAAPR